MTRFEKIKEIYDWVGWSYYGWNNPDRDPSCGKGGYFAQRGVPTIFKINAHNNFGSQISWDFIMRLANLIEFDLGCGPYNKDVIIDKMYEYICHHENKSR